MKPSPSIIKRTFQVFRKNYQQIPLELIGRQPYKNLISTILSSRTRDEVTYKVSCRLFKKAKNLDQLSKIPINELAKLIYPVAFYQQAKKTPTFSRG